MPSMNETFEAIAEEQYEPRGILNSEMALIIFTCRRFGIERMIESGRARGQSTYLLGKYLPDCEILSVEMRGGPDEAFARERLRDLANVELHEGDGNELVPFLAAEDQRPTAVLCDGPKGAAAVTILKRCFERPHVRLGFIHDMRRLDHGGPSPHRADAIARLPLHKFSDDPALVAGTTWMDRNVFAAGGPVGPEHEREFGSYGPTIGAFFNQTAKLQGMNP
jgi:hypothetical protein